jgi:hypothetical protein
MSGANEVNASCLDGKVLDSSLHKLNEGSTFLALNRRLKRRQNLSIPIARHPNRL